MSVPWVNGTVEAVLEDLRKAFGTDRHADTGRVYAAAVGMVTGLATEDERPYQRPRSLDERMADVKTVCQAVRRFEEELWEQ